jgi:putative endonuclease
MMEKYPCVYILASNRNGTLYTGVTSDLAGRIWQHKKNIVRGFTEHYNVHRLVWYEQHETMYNAIQREKQIKKWNRAWKVRLIEDMNSEWKDVYDHIV